MSALRFRGLWVFWVAAGLLIAPIVAVAQDVETVTVIGEGMTEDEARRDALRKALELMADAVEYARRCD